MNICNGFVQDEMGDWVNLKFIHSFYVNSIHGNFYITARTQGGDIGVSESYETNEEAQERLDKTMEGR